VLPITVQFCHTCKKKSETSDERKIPRNSINNMTRDDSIIKGALPVRCIHVSMVLNKQADSGILSMLCCQ
jgi:hypothetical protein